MNEKNPCYIVEAKRSAIGRFGGSLKSLTAADLAQTAKECLDSGASMIHMHVRKPDGKHLLDARAYIEATAAVRKAVVGVAGGLKRWKTRMSIGASRWRQQDRYHASTVRAVLAAPFFFEAAQVTQHIWDLSWGTSFTY